MSPLPPVWDILIDPLKNVRFQFGTIRAFIISIRTWLGRTMKQSLEILRPCRTRVSLWGKYIPGRLLSILARYFPMLEMTWQGNICKSNIYNNWFAYLSCFGSCEVFIKLNYNILIWRCRCGVDLSPISLASLSSCSGTVNTEIQINREQNIQPSHTLYPLITARPGSGDTDDPNTGCFVLNNRDGPADLRPTIVATVPQRERKVEMLVESISVIRVISSLLLTAASSHPLTFW